MKQSNAPCEGTARVGASRGTEKLQRGRSCVSAAALIVGKQGEERIHHMHPQVVIVVRAGSELIDQLLHLPTGVSTMSCKRSASTFSPAQAARVSSQEAPPPECGRIGTKPRERGGRVKFTSTLVIRRLHD